MDWIAFLHIFTIVNKLLLFPLFFFRKNNSLANRMLALLILLPVFPIISNYIFYTRPVSEFPHTMFASQLLFSLFGPVYFFYSMEMLGRTFKFSKLKLLHLLPALCILILWMVYTFLPAEKQYEFAAGFSKDGNPGWQMQAASIVPILLVLAYITASAWKVFRRAAAFKEVFTNLEHLKAGYIREFILVLIAEIILLCIVSVFTPVLYVDLVWVPILGNLMYFYIVYKSYNYGVVFSEKEYADFEKLYSPLNKYIEETEGQKYSGSVLSDLKLQEYAFQLQEGFKLQQWHLDPELNLNLLSQKTGIPAHGISQVINRQFNKNFFDLVNSYRVEELKIKLIDDNFTHLKIEELAYMCGFNSKAAFQRSFKKHTGLTPTEYRKLEAVSLKAV